LDKQLITITANLFNILDLFKDLETGSRKLGVLLRDTVNKGRITGQYFPGFWIDIGTPERLQALTELNWPANKAMLL